MGICASQDPEIKAMGEKIDLVQRELEEVTNRNECLKQALAILDNNTSIPNEAEKEVDLLANLDIFEEHSPPWSRRKAAYHTGVYGVVPRWCWTRASWVENIVQRNELLQHSPSPMVPKTSPQIEVENLNVDSSSE